MSKHLVVGASGLSSSLPLFGYFLQLPIKRILKAVERNDIEQMFFVWNKWPYVYQDIVAQKWNTISLFGHSYGADAVILLADLLKQKNVTVDLLAVIDNGIDNAAFIVDKPVGGNVKRLIEYYGVLEKTTIGSDFKGKHEFYSTRRGHIASAYASMTQDGIVNAIKETTQ